MKKIKWIILLASILLPGTTNFAQSSIEDISLLPIKLKLSNEDAQSVYMMDINSETITFFSDKDKLKFHLLDQCSSCQTAPLQAIEKLTIRSSKKHVGKIFGGFLALMITGIAALNPRGDGLDGIGTAGIYGSFYGGLTIGIGAAIDGVTNNRKGEGINKKKVKLLRKHVVDFFALKEVVNYTPLAQFELIQQKQKIDLQVMLLEIKSSPLMHQQRMSFFSKTQPVSSGYLVGNDATHLFLSDDLFSIIEDREKLTVSTYKKVLLADILYYQYN